jgi:hypothetical protein
VIIAQVVTELDEAGVLADWKNETDRYVAIQCACVTAPNPVRCEVRLQSQQRAFKTVLGLVDIVYCGGNSTHTWWNQASHGLVPGGILKPGERVVVVCDGKAAFRMDIDDGKSAEWTP